MLKIRDIHLSPEEDTRERLLAAALKTLRINKTQLQEMKILRRSIDARKKNAVILIYTVACRVAGDEQGILRKCGDPRVTLWDDEAYTLPKPSGEGAHRPVIVGFGPAGMFAGLALAEQGLKPIILERGLSVEERTEKVSSFWKGGKLDTECNVQFGEGGAGTFSDGKLNSGISDCRVQWILNRFYQFGADESVTYDALPHVGTDRLKTVVHNIRERIKSLGGEVRFGTKLTGLTVQDGCLRGVTAVNGGESISIETDAVILAVGHSARDTFQMLVDSGITAEQKPFSMGVRIEHLQSRINESQYGAFASSPALGPAPYKLNCKTSTGSAYTFCMCPGGYVVAAASEEGRVVTNGMSYFDRAGKNANSALLVTLNPEQFPERDVLSGVRWQQRIEAAAYEAGGRNYYAPCQLVGDFLKHRPSTGARSVEPTYQPGVTYTSIDKVLPKEITDVLREAIPQLARRLKGFDDPDAVLTAPEARSSSPVRLVRDRETLESVSVRGLYPCGEGAGYAGGIVSAAADGLRCAEKILLRESAGGQQ